MTSVPSRHTRSFDYISVAIHENYQDSEGTWQESTEWHTIKVWAKSSARGISSTNKGSKIHVKGQPVSTGLYVPELERVKRIAHNLGWSTSELLSQIMSTFVSSHTPSTAQKELTNHD